MSVLDRYAREYTRTLRARGEDYYYSHRVNLISLVPGREAIFKVRGTQLYDVRLRLKPNGDLVSSCTCPYFEGWSCCKHTWAVILDADKNNFFASRAEMRNVTPKKAGAGQQLRDFLSMPNSSEHSSRQKSQKLPIWKSKLKKLTTSQLQKEKSFRNNSSEASQVLSGHRVGYFAIDLQTTKIHEKWILKFYAREFRKNGDLGVLKSCSVHRDQISLYKDELDRNVLWTLLGMPAPLSNNYYYYREPKTEYVFLQGCFMDTHFEELSAAEKLLISTPQFELLPLKFDKSPLKLQLALLEKEKGFVLKASLRNESKIVNLNSSVFHLQPYLLSGSELYRAELENTKEWFDLFKKDPELFIPEAEIDGFLDFYFKSGTLLELSYPDTLGVITQSHFSKVRLILDSDQNSEMETTDLLGHIQFLYGEEFIASPDPRLQTFTSNGTTRTVYVRDRDKEKEEIKKLHDHFENIGMNSLDIFPIDESTIFPIVEKAFQLGWEVVAFRKIVNPSKTFKATISSGIDWFDLSADFEFSNGFIVGLPQLLQNIKTGQRFISLADGTTGLIREEWINKFKGMAHAGANEGNGIRLTKIQALFYGAELSDDKNFKADRKFKTFQRIIDDINNIEDAKIDPGFKGKLRKYQSKGHAWLNLMGKHEIGAILADDMGLGKTIQILAVLSKEKKTKTLILAPKSLVFNWINEAKKFTPHLRFHDHTGTDRNDRLAELEKAQVIVTTYQTFRMDVDFFQEKKFDYFILDEAHYIKNSESQAYMACKLITAKRKIALTGTPVENSIKDLFSILSVVTPGLISDSLAEKYANEMDPESLGALSKSLRPFILRRTKEEVLKDLPQKSEQILFCELSSGERKKYNELKNYYWNNLSGKIKNKGFQRSKIEILEALLRLRQASCHTGLLNASLRSGSSAKFELLFEQLNTVISDGHKALIFSQFTSLLGLLGKALSERKIPYEYLDGKTNNRAERVTNFQENDNMQVFLISLKAGGVGLNLTSADYVFILDPWWNPAAESQAIDRAHRIGQTKKVFAYKIIAKDTVEEKILALQEKKRALAKAVISSEKSLLKGLQMEDLQELFS